MVFGYLSVAHTGAVSGLSQLVLLILVAHGSSSAGVANVEAYREMR